VTDRHEKNEYFIVNSLHESTEVMKKMAHKDCAENWAGAIFPLTEPLGGA
jgi:L-rhamnose mutarotase